MEGLGKWGRHGKVWWAWEGFAGTDATLTVADETLVKFY